MKKVLVIVMLLAVLFAAVSVASAAPESNEEYLEEIFTLLKKIETALLAKDVEQADVFFKELQTLIHNCAAFLTKNKEYDARILTVISFAEDAFRYDPDTESAFIIEDFAFAANIAAIVLVHKTADKVVFGSLHS